LILYKAATRWLLLSLTVTAAANGYAAQPLSIQFLDNRTNDDGGEFTRYQLKCSNGTTFVLTSWNDKAHWCVGELVSGDCKNQQIAAARAACSSSQTPTPLPDPPVPQ